MQDRDVPWASTVDWELPAISGARYYVMEEDFLALDLVAHRNGSAECELQRDVVKSLYNNLGDTEYNSNLYQCYQLAGLDSPFIAEGVATGGNNTTMVDDSGIVDLSAVRVGDFIFNLNDDDASAVVTGITLSTGTVTFSEWVGGERHNFSSGDAYRIAQQERDRNVLWVWPPLQFDGKRILDVSVSNGGDRIALMPQQNGNISQLAVTFDPSLVSGTYTENVDITILIYYLGTNIIAEGSIGAPMEPGRNIVEIPNFLVNGQDNNYGIAAFSATTNVTDHITRVEMFAEDNTNILKLFYVPYPREMKNDRSICEMTLPSMQEAILLKAAEFAEEKREAFSANALTARSLYKDAINDIRKTLVERRGGGRQQVRGTQRTYGRWSQYGFADYLVR